MGLPLYVNITPRVADTASLNLSKYMSAELSHFSESSSRVRYAWQQVLSVHTSAPPLPHGLPPREAIFRAVYVRAAMDCAFSASSAKLAGISAAVTRRTYSSSGSEYTLSVSALYMLTVASSPSAVGASLSPSYPPRAMAQPRSISTNSDIASAISPSFVIFSVLSLILPIPDIYEA